MSPAHFEAINPYGTLSFAIAGVLKRARSPSLPLIRVSRCIVGHFGAITQATPLVGRNALRRGGVDAQRSPPPARYLEAAADGLARRGQPIPRTAWTHLMPVLWEHIHFVGHYPFQEPVITGELRALLTDATA